MSDSQFFYEAKGQPTEGMLDKDKNLADAELLFIFREPNSRGKNANTFWIREVFERKIDDFSAKRYFNILGTIAVLLLDGDKDSDEGKKEALSRCAYINLFPKRG